MIFGAIYFSGSAVALWMWWREVRTQPMPGDWWGMVLAIMYSWVAVAAFALHNISEER